MQLYIYNIHILRHLSTIYCFKLELKHSRYRSHILLNINSYLYNVFQHKYIIHLSIAIQILLCNI